jgi:hypothetical protein
MRPKQWVPRVHALGWASTGYCACTHGQHDSALFTAGCVTAVFYTIVELCGTLCAADFRSLCMAHWQVVYAIGSVRADLVTRLPVGSDTTLSRAV